MYLYFSKLFKLYFYYNFYIFLYFSSIKFYFILNDSFVEKHVIKVEEPGSTETILSDFIILSLFSIISISYGMIKKYLFDLVFYILHSWNFLSCVLLKTCFNNLFFIKVLFDKYNFPNF